MKRRFPDSPVFYRDLKRDYRSAVRGRGVFLEDDAGRRYLDAAGGALVVNLGHGRSELAEAMATQAEAVSYVHGSQFTTDALERWASALARYLPGGPHRHKLYLVTGGTEATETALKLARQYHHSRGNETRHRTVACRPSYHGNTLGALSVSGRDLLRAPYAPMLAAGTHAPAPYCYRCPLQKTYPSCDVACADLDEFLDETVAAFIVEPVLGASAGVSVPPEEYLSRVREQCDARDVLLIVDEVLTGMGRTGRFLALERSAIEPDIVLLGKGLSGGAIPAGAVAVRRDIVSSIVSAFGAFTHGYTFSHHPVVAAVALRTLELIESEDLIERVRTLEPPFREGLERLRRFECVGDVRSAGLLGGIELVADRETKTPFPRTSRFAETLTASAFENGLLVYPTTGIADGTNGDGVVLAPPFVIDASEMDDLFRRLEETLGRLSGVCGVIR